MYQRLSAIAHVENNSNTRKLTLHNTAVVTVSGDTVTLDTGGWFTPTTKKYMNKGLDLFGLNGYVYQKAGDWFVEDNEGNAHKFFGNTVTIPTDKL